MAGIDTLPAYEYKNCAGAATYVVSAGPCVLHTLTINTTAASAITIYDNTAASGTKIATLAASPAIGSTFRFDVRCRTGLTIVLAGASDVTASFATL